MLTSGKSPFVFHFILDFCDNQTAVRFILDISFGWEIIQILPSIIEVM
jgi:hypothetical protein